MRTGIEMYNAAYEADCVGFPGLLWPMRFLARKSFEEIEKRMLLENEEVVFPFMMIADTDLFDNQLSNQQYGGPNRGQGYDYDAPDQNGSVRRPKRHWTAFALTSRAHIYYARWIPFNSDYGDMPIQTGDININVDRRFFPMTSTMDISTLRRSFLRMTNKYNSIQYIRNSILQTLDALEHHTESEDGRRVYNQFASGKFSDLDNYNDDI